MTNTRSASKRVPAILSVIAILAAFAIYFGYGVADLGVPGAQYDEVADAVPAMEMLTGQPVSSLSTVTVFGQQLPLMMLHHIGPTSIFTSFIGMAIFGISIQSLRLTQLIIGALTLLLLWLLSRRWFDQHTAAITVILCASAPAFIWWNRAGINWTAPLLPLSLAMLLLLEYWWQTRQPVALVGAAFLLGAGITTKILFVWFLAPIALSALFIFGPVHLLRSIRRVRLGTSILAVIALLIGLGPLIVHNIQSPLATIRFLTDNALTTRIYGHNNLDLYSNLRKVVTEFLLMMGGDTIAFNAPTGLLLGSLAFIASLAYLTVFCIRFRTHIRQATASPKGMPTSTRGMRLRLFMVIAIATIIPLSTISTSSVGATYLFTLVPLAWLLIGVTIHDGVVFLLRIIVQSRAAVIGFGFVFALLLNNISTDTAIFAFFQSTGGHGFWSDTINTLTGKLESTYSSRTIAAMDWGFSRNAEFLSLGQVHIREGYEYLPEPSPQFANVATVLLRDPSNIYLFHTPELTAFKGHFQALERAAARSHKQLTLLEVLNERSGIPNTLVYQADEAPHRYDVSPTLATRKAAFAGGLTLLGGTVNYDPTKREVAVDLLWQTIVDHQADDTVLLHIVDQSNGNVVLNGDQQPVYGSYPFAVWQKGEVVYDPHWLTLPADLKPGVYQVRVGVYDRTSGARRAINDPQNDAAGNSLMLHSFETK
jgi:4-amino-4-deoxy-L-arabinose transferase-like glycosyltransferase